MTGIRKSKNTTSKPKLSILIPTVGERDDRFKKLVETLSPQVQKHKGRVEVVVFWNNFDTPLAEIRQALVNEARGEYISFIDDDDSVPEYYCDRILAATKTRPDYIGWRMQLWFNGQKMKPTYHSIEYTEWSDDGDGYYRNASHLNPVKRSIALQVPFHQGDDKFYGTAEDYSWSQRVAPLLKTEEYIEDVMYFYYANTNDSIWRGDKVPKQNYIRPPLPVRFRYHPDSKPAYFVNPKTSAVIICDVWDEHWHKPTQKALDQGFAAKINDFCNKMRDKESIIIHAPTSVTHKYAGRSITLQDKFSDIASPSSVFYVPCPVNYYKPWTKQHPDIEIDQNDYISDSPHAIFSLLKQFGITRVYMVGMHMELCVIHNSFGAFNLIQHNFIPIIVQDVTLPYGERDAVEEMVRNAGFYLATSEDVLTKDVLA